MGRDLTSAALEERWADYLRLRGENAIYSAFVRLGEIANCLRYAQVPPELVSKWAASIEEVSISPDSVQSIRREARNKVERLRRILDGGSEFTYEEMLLVITFRAELEMLSGYLAERGVGDLTDASALDNELLAIARSSKTSAVYLSAQESARKNWGLPLQSKWLGTDAVH